MIANVENLETWSLETDKCPGHTTEPEQPTITYEQAFSKFGWIGTSANYADETIQAAFLDAYKATLE